MEVNDQEALRADRRNDIRWRVQSGFYTADEIIHHFAEGMTLSEAKKKVRSVVADEWAMQLEAQQTWPPGPTVSDKVATAFDSLERNHKILARMNCACCNSCGIAELGEDRDSDTRGYVFFHEQTTESVMDDGDLYLAYGSFSKSVRRNREVGETIVRSLRRAGLRVEWSGDEGRKILVRCGEWRRRLDGDDELEDIRDDSFDSDCMSSSEEEDEEAEVNSEPASSDGNATI
ncbi:hypothetical protein K4F52_001229 [Lecanicillium sp. MT-2017a]|nr:hypothetical protein K4F52_001229 [Lecanicillium sp. MT-2017a]